VSLDDHLVLVALPRRLELPSLADERPRVDTFARLMRELGRLPSVLHLVDVELPVLAARGQETPVRQGPQLVPKVPGSTKWKGLLRLTRDADCLVEPGSSKVLALIRSEAIPTLLVRRLGHRHHEEEMPQYRTSRLKGVSVCET
jgi:hypothetical protein